MAAVKAEAFGKIFNIAGGREISDLLLARMVIKAAGREELTPGHDHTGDFPVVPFRLFAKPERAASVLDWQPVVSLEEGLQLTVEWMKTNRKEIKRAYRVAVNRERARDGLPPLED